jgi:hypothetical protein
MQERKWPRRLLNTKITFVREGGLQTSEPCSGWVKNVSDGGVAFSTHADVLDGSVVDMRVVLFEGTPSRQIRGRVVWTRSTESGMDVGVRFIS